jgi:hypothetical protein
MLALVPSEASVAGKTHGAGEQFTPGGDEGEIGAVGGREPSFRDCPMAHGGSDANSSASGRNRVFMTDGQEQKEN